MVKRRVAMVGRLSDRVSEMRAGLQPLYVHCCIVLFFSFCSFWNVKIGKRRDASSLGIIQHIKSSMYRCIALGRVTPGVFGFLPPTFPFAPRCTAAV